MQVKIARAFRTYQLRKHLKMNILLATLFYKEAPFKQVQLTSNFTVPPWEVTLLPLKRLLGCLRDEILASLQAILH